MIKLCATICLSTIFFSCSNATEKNEVSADKGKKSNVLFILTDDQVYRSIGSLNNKEIYTPNLDRLAKSSKIMTNIFNQGANQGAVCVASRAMINTGLPLWRAIDKINKQETPLLGEVFAQNGYKTFFGGKWHNKFETLKKSFQWYGTKDGKIIATKNVVNKNAIFKVKGMLSSQFNNDYRKGWTPASVRLGGHWRNVEGKTYHSSELITQSAINFLDEQTGNNEKPFFMYVAYFAPHDPRQAPKKYLNLYKAEDLQIPPNFLPIYPFDIGVHSIRAEKIPAYPRQKKELQLHRRDYYAIISHLDEQIGLLLDKLENNPRYENTYVIFTSDHGLSIGEHGLYAKQSLFDHAQKVPFFIKGPKVINKVKDDTPINLYQLFSTMADLCDLKLPTSIPDKSFASLLTGEKTYNQSNYIYTAYKDHSRSVMNKNYKIIIYPLLKQILLFDRNKDKWEMNNIALGNDIIIQKFYTELKRLQKEVADRLVLPSINQVLNWEKPHHNIEAKLPKKLDDIIQKKKNDL